MIKTVKTPIKVRFSECDYYKHVNNTTYLTYMDVGLSDYLRTIWPDLRKLDVLFHKVHISIDFKNSATFDDDLLVSTAISKIGTTSITFSHNIKKKDGLLIAKAEIVFALLDLKTGKKCNIPKELRN